MARNFIAEQYSNVTKGKLLKSGGAIFKRLEQSLLLFLLALCLCVCGSQPTSPKPAGNLPNLGIDWNLLVKNVKTADRGPSGLFVDKDALESNIAQGGTISFLNYDPTKENSWKALEYQLSIEYGAGFAAKGGKMDIMRSRFIR